MRSRPESSVNVGASRARTVLERTRAVPPGRVTTYADLDPAAPRHAGAVLSACDDASLPWHRIVRADGSLAKGERQRLLLDAEGVPFTGDRVDMRAAWVPAARRHESWSDVGLAMRNLCRPHSPVSTTR